MFTSTAVADEVTDAADFVASDGVAPDTEALDPATFASSVSLQFLQALIKSKQLFYYD